MTYVVKSLINLNTFLQVAENVDHLLRLCRIDISHTEEDLRFLRLAPILNPVYSQSTTNVNQW